MSRRTQMKQIQSRVMTTSTSNSACGGSVEFGAPAIDEDNREVMM